MGSARVALTAGLAGALLASPAHAVTRAPVMVVGKARLLVAARTVGMPQTTVRASGRTCLVAERTPLSALVAADRTGGPPVIVRDDGSCSSRRTLDSASLFVTKVGADRNSGRDGWVYKVGHRAGTTGAADPTGPFGTGRRVREGQRVLWFWCRMNRRGGCQRTLDTRVVARSGRRVTVQVTGYDDAGHGRRIAGATVTLAGRGATTGSDGRATIVVPRPGRFVLGAARSSMVRAFPRQVVIS